MTRNTVRRVEVAAPIYESGDRTAAGRDVYHNAQ